LNRPEVCGSFEADISVSENLEGNVEVSSGIVHSSVIPSIEEVVLTSDESCSPSPSKWSVNNIEDV
jgi:hypothetical protein